MKLRNELNPVKSATAGSKQQATFAYLVSGFFVMLACYGSINHEMWRDEYQPWLIARDSHSLSQLYNNMRYEGHPMLWHLLLYFISAFTINPGAMKVIHLLWSAGAVFIFVRHAPFSRLSKVFFCFGYYMLFEYTLINRCYSLEIFLLFLYCSAYRHLSIHNSFFLFLIITLIANCSVFGLVISVGLMALLLYDLTLNKKILRSTSGARYNFSGGLLLVCGGLLFSYLQVNPEADNYLHVDMLSLLDINRWKIILSRLYNAFTLLPEYAVLPNWNTMGGYSFDYKTLDSNLFLSVLILLPALLCLVRKPALLIFYVFTTASILAVLNLIFVFPARYIGHLMLVFLISLWMDENFREHVYKNKLLQSLSVLGVKLRAPLFAVLTGIQLIPGAAYYMYDLRLNFSNISAASLFIKEQRLDTLEVVGSVDFALSPFSATLNKPVYFSDAGKKGTFIIWDNTRNETIDFTRTEMTLQSVIGKDKKGALLILNYPVERAPDAWKLLDENVGVSGLTLKFLRAFKNGMVDDENYYIYLAHRTPPKQPGIRDAY